MSHLSAVEPAMHSSLNYHISVRTGELGAPPSRISILERLFGAVPACVAAGCTVRRNAFPPSERA